MRLTPALLVIVDISGYTEFVTNRRISLLHAENIITALMEAVVEHASRPLVVNKLEGDAALLFLEYTAQDAEPAATDVLAQVGGFFRVVDAKLAEFRTHSQCDCEACTGTDKLCLKAFVHAGEIAVKQVSRFEELAGEPVILLHRLLKNQVPSREYVLLSEQVRAMAPTAVANLRPHVEQVDGLGEHHLWLANPGDLPELAPLAEPAAGNPDIPVCSGEFRNLPGRPPTGLRRTLAALAARWFG